MEQVLTVLAQYPIVYYGVCVFLGYHAFLYSVERTRHVFRQEPQNAVPS